MRDSDFYPAGAYSDPNAPYNQCDPPETELEVTVQETLVRGAVIVTNNAFYVEDEEGGYLETEDVRPREDYERDNRLLAQYVYEAWEEITKLRIEAERQQIILEQHYGVRHNTIPGLFGNATEFEKRRRSQLSEAMDRVRKLKALEAGLEGWEYEDIDVELD